MLKVKKTIAEISDEALKIEAVLKTLPAGHVVSYKELEELSGVKMNLQGKGFMRTALNRLKLEYTVIHGEGIELASPDNSTRIIATRVIKIDNAVKKAEKTVKNVNNQFFEQLNDIEKKNVAYLGALFGTIRQYSQSAKTFFKKEQPKVIN